MSLFDEAIRSTVKRVREKRIWDKALGIIKQFGREKRETRSYCVATSGRFTITFGKDVLDIVSESHGQFHENLDVKIWYKEALVFEATRTAWTEKYDERRVVKRGNGSAIVLKRFQDGDWVDLLSIKKTKEKLTPKVAKPKKVEKVFVEDDGVLARDFGLRF